MRAIWFAVCVAGPLLAAGPGPAAPVVWGADRAPMAGGGAPLLRVQQPDIPDIVRLLAQRARRAERRGDVETAQELYDTIRSLGYVVRRRPAPGSDGAEDDRERGDGRSFGRGTARDDDDDDDDDDGDDDDGDDDDGGDDDDDDDDD